MNDPYMDFGNCVDRLMKEYHTHKKLIVAVDFDDTIFDFHNAGHTYGALADLLRRCQAHDFYIVIFTGAQKSKWDSQRIHLENIGIAIHSVNQNPIPLPFGNDGKIYYNILLDDRAGLGQAYSILTQVLDRIEREK